MIRVALLSVAIGLLAGHFASEGIARAAYDAVAGDRRP